jgi:outer membrane protein OmpA-like peptidoglycan-associated protein
MSNVSGRRNLAAIRSLLTIGAAALSIGVARAAEDFTEDQIVRALAPAKKPVTRGLALSNPHLKGSTFIVAGHTDAAGDAYNQDLSERRTDSIKRYLVDEFGIAGTDLVTVGYGKTKLKDPANPLSEVNRRVQVANMDNKATASK